MFSVSDILKKIQTAKRIETSLNQVGSHVFDYCIVPKSFLFNAMFCSQNTVISETLGSKFLYDTETNVITDQCKLFQ